MTARRPLRMLLAAAAAGLALILASGAFAEAGVRWVHYITPDGIFHATRDPAKVPPEAATIRPSAETTRETGELCHTVERMDARGLGYWARHGVLRVPAEEPVRSCLGDSASDIARAMARHCEVNGTRGYQVWSDLVSRALRDCEG